MGLKAAGTTRQRPPAVPKTLEYARRHTRCHQYRRPLIMSFTLVDVCTPQQGSFVYTRDRLLSLKGSIAAEIESLGGHLGLSRLIEGLDRQLEGLDLAEPATAEPAEGVQGGTLDSL